MSRPSLLLQQRQRPAAASTAAAAADATAAARATPALIKRCNLRSLRRLPAPRLPLSFPSVTSATSVIAMTSASATEQGAIGAAEAAKAAPATLSSSSMSSSDGDESDETSSSTSSASSTPSTSTSSSSSSLEAESLGMLEWPAVCRQVACLTQTPMGARAALFSESNSSGRKEARRKKKSLLGRRRRPRGIPLASTREEAERLLDETEAALEALSSSLASLPFDLSGALDLTQLLDSLLIADGKEGRKDDEEEACSDNQEQPQLSSSVVTPLAVAGVADTLEAAAAAEKATGGFEALAALAAGRLGSPGLTQLLLKLREAVPRGEARLIDSATPELAEARARRREADAAARAAAAEWSKKLFAAGASARAAVAMRRDRLCVPVLTARKSELPRGSVALATSASGATSFCEPAPLVPLNNEAAAARQAEEAAENAALVALTGLVVARGQELRGIVEAVAALDVARARAEHARWVSGGWQGRTKENKEKEKSSSSSSPSFSPSSSSSPSKVSPHPCVAARPRLLDPSQGRAEGAVRIEGLLHPLLLERALPRLPNPPGVEEDDGEEEVAETEEERDNSFSSFPRGLAFRVPQGTSVVVITGPNTGGKTAGLKSLGLASLMARAGLFFAVEKKNHDDVKKSSPSSSSPPSPSPSSNDPPSLSFFDAVLADVGDPQSLAASLSTFSGHVRRAARALEAVRGGDEKTSSSSSASSSTKSALVLLDELGAGTDPSEGAALGAALLDAFAESSGAALTVATAHFAELKGDGRPHVADAAVEFDPVALAPTYRLLWGSGPGASCALEVARGLGFDLDIVEAAAASLGRKGFGGESEGDEDGEDDGENGSDLSALASASTSSSSFSSPASPSPSSRTRADVLAAAAGLASTLAADLNAAREDASRAAGERAAAEAEAEAAARAAAEAAERERSAADARSRASAAADADVSWALAAFERGELSEEEAAEALAELAASAPNAAEAAARLARARTGGGDEDDGDDAPSAPTTAAAAWLPAVGETVSVLKMGNQLAVVTRAPRSPGASLVVRLRKGLDVTLRTFEVAPPPREGGGNAAGEKRGQERSGGQKASSSSSLRGAARSGSLSASGSRLFSVPKTARKSPDAPAIKTPDNTVDVRGLDASSAAAAVRDAVGCADDGDALFIVHGLGAGVLKKAVRQQLASMVAEAERKAKGKKKGSVTIGGGVASYGDDGESAGGVTLVRVRR